MSLIPAAIKVKKSSQCVSLTYNINNQVQSYDLSFEFLRVHSPSAEVRGHGVGQEVLQVGKKDVVLLTIEPAGNYALKLVFDDGHDSGLYDWAYLHHLAVNQGTLWQEYCDKLEAAGASRDGQFISLKSI